MAAPEFVPAAPIRSAARAYVSPPRRKDSWHADRPGDLGGTPQPAGGALGAQGPDQGYALALARRLADRVILADGEHLDDVLAAGAALGMRRASLFGRAPVVADLEVGLTLLGYLGDHRPDALVEWRRHAVAEIASPHHYAERRLLANGPPEAVLRLAPAAAARARDDGWEKALGL